MKCKQLVSAAAAIILSLNIIAANAASTPNESLSSLIKLSLDNAPSRISSEDDSALQTEISRDTSKQRFIPQIDFTASYQKSTYSQLYTGGPTPISNNGDNPTIGLSFSYDLQKVFGPESALAQENSYYAKLQEKIVARDIVRNVKKLFFTIKEIDQEILELQKLISLFSKTESILLRQKNLGLNNQPEMQQFNIQKGILNADLQGKINDRENAFFALANLTHLETSEIKLKISKIPNEAPLHFPDTTKISETSVDKLTDASLLESLSHDYNAAMLEYDKFNSFPLPVVFLRGLRQWPDIPSADGPSTTTEVGFSLPISDFFTRSLTKSQLKGKAMKSQHLMEKNIFEYRTMIKTAIFNLQQSQGQKKNLEEMQKQSEKLLDKSFTLYSQKRIDSLGALDIFQKYLQSTRLVLMNQLLTQSTDADLEYLVGDQAL